VKWAENFIIFGPAIENVRWPKYDSDVGGVSWISDLWSHSFECIIYFVWML